jgi:4-hydroxyphenylacetate 3-monooxygenase
MLGRRVDYLNSALMALSGESPWFEQGDAAYGENIRRYYERLREEDLLTARTCGDPLPALA